MCWADILAAELLVMDLFFGLSSDLLQGMGGLLVTPELASTPSESVSDAKQDQ